MVTLEEHVEWASSIGVAAIGYYNPLCIVTAGYF